MRNYTCIFLFAQQKKDKSGTKKDLSLTGGWLKGVEGRDQQEWDGKSEERRHDIVHILRYSSDFQSNCNSPPCQINAI